MKKVAVLFNKFLVIFFSLGGVLLSMLTAQKDGYSGWSKRLMYFTGQSNLWLGFTQVFLVTALLSKREKYLEKLYFLRYIFTVAITVTGIVFCGLLGPNADESYRPWSLSSIMTHALSPAFAIVDFFVDKRKIRLSIKSVGSALIAPGLYTTIASVLCLLGVDFGRGEAFPYFFMNYFSPAGVFGFSKRMPYIIGSFYWIAMLVIIIVAVAVLYAYLSGIELKNPRKSVTGNA